MSAPTATRPTYDVAVIGAGAVGCAVARELAGHRLTVALVEARSDVGDGTSKANTAILHTGFDATPGTLEARLVPRGYALLSDYAAHTGIALERTGALLVAWNDDELAVLPEIQAKARANGYDACDIVDTEAAYALEPNLGPGIRGGLTVPGESIVCPWTTVLALATDAVTRGAALLLGRRVEGFEVLADRTVLTTTRGPLEARWVVNAAGLGSGVVDQALGGGAFTVTPRRGELIVFDKLARGLVERILLPVPTARGKGVLVAPTVYGNVLLGPTADDVKDPEDTSTTAAGLRGLIERGGRIVPALLHEEVTATYAGLRAATEHGDYQVRLDPDRRTLTLGGIRSTGITAAMALGEHAVELLGGAGLHLEPRSSLPDPPTMPPIGESSLRPYADPARVAVDPEYGRLICFCERVSRGEVRDALASRVPPTDVGGLQRRTRATMGRCQGFFCAAEVSQALRPGGAA